MGRKKDRFWEHAEELNDKFKCNFCQLQFTGGISRIKAHLAKVTGRNIIACTDVPEDVQEEAYIAIGGPNKKAKGVPSTSNFEKNKTTSTASSSPSTTLHHSTTLELCNSKDKSAVDKLLAQHVVLNNIPIDVVQTTPFSRFVQGVAKYGPEYRLPSDSTLKTKLIPDLRMEVDDYVGNVKKSWVATGCTLMLDLWVNKKQEDFISIIAYSPKGAVFMNSFEIPNKGRAEINLANIVSSVIEEIGHDHVVQFITNARKFESVGDELLLKYPRMYKTRCAAHGIHLLLKDIYEEVGWVKKVIDDANLIVTYKHRNTIISSLMREHTNNKELKRPCMTRFASNFLMLQSIFDVKKELRSLVASSEWRELDCNKEDKAKRVTSIIGSSEFWSQGQEVLEILNPFVRVLQLAESDGSTSGYLYEAMERAKGSISQQCANNQSKYVQIWELFEKGHYENIVHPIHAAAAFLNPAYMCNENFRENPKMIEGIGFILENLVGSEEEKNFMEEFQIYHIKESKLFTKMAMTMLETSHPRTWWELNGHSLPTLKKFAIRILSQPCSSSSYKRNWGAFEAAQAKKRNRLAFKLLDNLVHVRMNTMMMEKFTMLEAQGTKPIDLDKLGELIEYVDHEQDYVGDALDAIDEGLDDDVIIKDANPSQLDEAQGTKPIDLDKLSELPESADHELDCEGDALDAINEVDDNVIMNDADSSRPNEAQGTKPIDLDKLSELPEYADHELDCEGDALDAINEVDDNVIMNDADSSRPNEYSFCQMENVGEAVVPDFLQLENSPELQEFAQQKQVDTELEKKDESPVYGREKDKEAILDLLLRDEGIDNNRVRVISIIGMGGVGKTTLAQLVYDDSKVKDCFDKKAWVSVSEEFDVLRILADILRQVDLETGEDEISYNDDISVSIQLIHQLIGKKFLLVLDDVWNNSCDQFFDQNRYLMEGVLVSRIVVITRDESVASTIGSFFHKKKTIGSFSSYHLKELSFDNCLSLFTHHALGTKFFDGHSNLKVIGEQIVGGCKGLPLAVKTLGSLLRNTQNCDVWKGILNSEIWKFLEEGNDIITVLSYHHLPSHLKQCFAYCAIFPKGYEFDKDELILLWMAEGFLQEPNEKKHMEDLGLEYFQELLSRSLFQQSIRNKSRFVMHDLINDLAKTVAGKTCFNLEVDTLYESFKMIRHSSFGARNFDASQRFEVFYHMKGLETFLVSSVPVSGYNFLSNKVLHDLLPRLGYLRSLSLSGYAITELPDSIGGLMQLRYLNLSYSNICRLPESLSALINLQTLILRGCKELTKLPEGIGNLPNLHHLDIIDTDDLEEMPSGIGNLTSLQTLSKFIVGKDESLRVRDLENLSNLRGHLSILKLHNVLETEDAMIANLKEKQGLDELVLGFSDDDEVSERNEVVAILKKKQGHVLIPEQSDVDQVSKQIDDDEIQVLDSLQPHEYLKKLTITSYGGTKFPSWIGDPAFSNLVQLNLHYCRKSTLLPSLGQLPSLKNLSIKGMNAVEAVGVEFYGGNSPSVNAFPSLESLSFEDMFEWKEWWSSSTAVETFPCLRKLVLQNCPNLTKLPRHFVSLDNLYISGCPSLGYSIVRLPSLRELKIEYCHVVVLISMVDLISLKTLTIVKMPGLACLDMLVLEGLEVLQIKDCCELMSLWEDGANLENLARLKKLVVKNCPQLASLAGEEGGLLPCYLEELELVRCNNLKKLPNGLHSLRCLRSLIIDMCPKLVSFPATGLPNTLRRLLLYHCMALESLPDGMTIHGGNSNQCLLEELGIFGCNSLKSFPRGMLPTTVKSLQIEDCGNLESLPEGMMLDDNDSNNTSHLESIIIFDCTQLKSLSKRILHNNTALESINLSGCTNLRSLPLECLHRLTHLRGLYISDCPALESFPKRGLSIPNLKTLQIRNCENLKSLSKMHYLTSLQTLIIEICPQIVSFPEEGLPPNLTSLKISYCENLPQSMSEWSLHRLSSLREFTLQFISHRCPLDMVSFPDDDCCLLPTTLTYICIFGISNLESISKGIQNLTSLEKLEIRFCYDLHSLPKEGLPASLGYLYIWGCPILGERCLKEKGEYWPIISHIPCVRIDAEIQ